MLCKLHSVYNTLHTLCDITQKVSNHYTVEGQFFAFNLEKKLHRAENFYTDAVCGVCDKYRVCMSRIKPWCGMIGFISWIKCSSCSHSYSYILDDSIILFAFAGVRMTKWLVIRRQESKNIVQPDVQPTSSPTAQFAYFKPTSHWGFLLKQKLSILQSHDWMMIWVLTKKCSKIDPKMR